MHLIFKYTRERISTSLQVKQVKIANYAQWQYVAKTQDFPDIFSKIICFLKFWIFCKKCENMFQKTIETHVEAANLEKFVKFRLMIWRKRYVRARRTVQTDGHMSVGRLKTIIGDLSKSEIFFQIDFQNTKLTFSKWYSTLIYTPLSSFLIVHPNQNRIRSRVFGPGPKGILGVTALGRLKITIWCTLYFAI